MANPQVNARVQKHRDALRMAGLRPVQIESSMDDAVAAASSLAQPGDVVLLSPGCASFDWYSSYAERGDDFTRSVHALHAGALG